MKNNNNVKKTLAILALLVMGLLFNIMVDTAPRGGGSGGGGGTP